MGSVHVSYLARKFALPDDNKLSADRLSRALADYDDTSRQVSTNNRYISFGLIAITYTLLSSDAAIAKELVQKDGTLILLVGGFGCLGVMFDYLHYMCGFSAANRAVLNKTPGHEHQYNENWPAYVWRERFYALRTVTALGGATLLIALSWPTVASAGKQPQPNPASVARQK